MSGLDDWVSRYPFDPPSDVLEEREAIIAEHLAELMEEWALEPDDEIQEVPTPADDMSTRPVITLRDLTQQLDISLVEVSDLGSEDERDESDLPQDYSYPEEDIHTGLNGSEGDENARACLPCPFCYVDIEVQVLCCHLQDEHCFNLKDAVCPLCAASLGKDVTGHFIAQHVTSFRRRRKSNKTSANGRTNISGAVADPLLLPFLSSSVPDSASKARQEDSSSQKTSPATESSGVVSTNDDADREEKRQKASFVQELIASTIFN